MNVEAENTIAEMEEDADLSRNYVCELACRGS